MGRRACAARHGPARTGTPHKIKALALTAVGWQPPSGHLHQPRKPVSIPWPGFSSRDGLSARVWPRSRWNPSPGSDVFQASGRKWQFPSATCISPDRVSSVSRSPAPQRRASFVGTGSQIETF